MQWTEKYRPVTFQDFLINPRYRALIDNYFSSENPSSKILLLSGPEGCGKTTLVRIGAEKYGLYLQEINSSDDRSLKFVKELRQSLMLNTFDDENKCILLDECDGVRDWRGIHKLVNVCNCHIVMCCNYIEKIPREIVNSSIHIVLSYKLLPLDEKIRFLLGIAKKEGYEVQLPDLHNVLKNSVSMRNAVNNLQRLCEWGDDPTPHDCDLGVKDSIKSILGGVRRGDLQRRGDLRRALLRYSLYNGVPLNQIEELNHLLYLQKRVPFLSRIVDGYGNSMRSTYRVRELNKPPFYFFHVKKEKKESKRKRRKVKRKENKPLVQSKKPRKSFNIEDGF